MGAAVLLVTVVVGWLVVLIRAKKALKCPAKGGPVIVRGGRVVHLRRSSTGGTLCLLARVSKSSNVDAELDEEEYAGVGRSYNGHEWEAVAGPYVETKFECKGPRLSKKGKTKPCRVRLPEAPRGYQFVLLPLRRRRALSSSEESARFLEQATFGARREDLWRTTNPPVWLQSQMRDTPMTLHRAYFRRRATPRMPKVPGDPAMFLQTHPCRQYSRWRRHAFTPLDLRRFVQIEESKPGGPDNEPQYTLAIDGEIRTVVAELRFKNPTYELQVPGRYEICQHTVEDQVGGRLFLRHPSDGTCLEVGSPGNPPVRIVFWVHHPKLLLTLPMEQLNPIPGSDETEYLLLEDFMDEEVCSQIPTVMEENLVVYARMGSTNKFLLYDPHVQMHSNTPSQPWSDGGGFASLSSGGLMQCSNAPRTFVNEASCRLSFASSACGHRATMENVSMKLVHGTLQSFFHVTGRLVYAIQDLRLPQGSPSPCTPGVRSRWIPAFGRGCTQNGLAPATRDILAQLLQAAPASAKMRDIVFSQAGPRCASQDVDKIGIKVNVDEGNCWQHVHPDYWNVYDFTDWAAETDAHPGNPVRAAVGLPNPIANPARQGESRLTFPASHDMQDWSSNVHQHLSFIGRFGEKVHFVDLPDTLRIPAVAEAVGALGTNRTGEGVVVCGSPGEVANNPWVMNGKRNSYDLTLNHAVDMGTRQRVSVWTQIALGSSDQLRQRVAWALSQIFCISPHNFVLRDNSESFLNYYDIMVRHAFGNLQDLLREVAFSPMMAEMLTYIQSKSTGYIYFHEDRIAAPDENFAREVMQLFTMGPTLLNMDGTPVRDPETGETIRVYDNDDIQSFARAWTGFDKQQRRSNLEDYFGSPKLNWVDPLRIRRNWRDPFPKKDLYDGFIGDQYPRCRDLPNRAFLRKGARYRLLGSTSQPDLQVDPLEWEGDPNVKRVVLDGARSTLYRSLCRAKDNGECSYPTRVILQRNLPCRGMECRVDTVRVVQVAPNIYYEYVPLACVQMAFYDTPALIKSPSGGTVLCADAQLPAASTACCARGFRNVAHQNQTCEYLGERVTWNEAQARCNHPARHAEMCPFRQVSTETCGACCKSHTFFWSLQPCQLRVKVAADGKIAIVHNPGGPPSVNADTVNFFSIKWDDDNYPSVEGNRCGRGVCEEVEGGACLCEVEVEESPVFTSVSQVKNRQQVLRRLHVGSVPPDTYANGYFRKSTVDAESGIFAYSRSSDGETTRLNEEAVLQVQDDVGRTLYLKNVESTVKIMDADARLSFSFRNPPHFATLVDLNVRDIYYEIDAVLEHYTLHQNVAPFISFRLIQRLAGISNPSPLYVKRVATAFRQGSYQEGGVSFGTGQYGDLAATVAALLLDREARSSVLDADPAHGSLREPLLKVIGFMRAMEFQPATPRVDLFDLDILIGQQPHAIPSVFNFFRPEYVPDGPATTALLKSPEALVHSTPTVIGILNGLFSLIKFGLVGCFHGFGTGLCCTCWEFVEGEYTSPFGNLTFVPSNEKAPLAVVNEMATLLTAGRLGRMNRRIIADQYARAPDAGAALRVAQQLMVTTPEFHATGLVQKDGSARPPVAELPPPPTKGKDYKVIVYLLQEGGSDSYNMLVPHSECGAKDLYQEYRQVRSSVAVPQQDLHVIDATFSPQPCAKFGVHPALPTLAQLYQEGELLFLANVGILRTRVTKENYLQLTKAELFAHNFMQTEVKRLDLLEERFGTGILGRFVDILQKQGWRTSAISVEEPSLAVVGTPKVSPPAKVIRRGGQVNEFNPLPSSKRIRPTIRLLNAATAATSSVHGETWSRKLDLALDENESLFTAVDGITLRHEFEETEVGGGFEAVAKFIAAHEERGVDRDVFYIRQTGYDQHLWYDKLGERFQEMSHALQSFAAEMKERNLWDNVVVVNVSEFGRTMAPNSNSGTDHGWAGNYFLAGGQVNGGKILGQFPDDLTETGPWDVGRGRYIPTTSWDAVWNGVGDWFGVSNLNRAIPNRLQFQEDLFWKGDFFRSDTATQNARKKAETDRDVNDEDQR